MNPWPFIVGAYAIGLGATLGMTLWSWLAMRQAEAKAEQIGRDS